MDSSSKPLRVQMAFAAWSFVGLAACGTATHEGTLVPQVLQQATPQEQTIPESTIRQLEECAREAGGRYAKYSHAIQFDIEVTSNGDVTRVKLRDSTLDDGVLESCMMRAVAAMYVQVDRLPLRSNQPFSGGERMKRSGEPLGIAQALGGMVALGPIIIVAGGATIGVYIGAVVVDKVVDTVVEAVEKRRRAIETKCMELQVECLNNPLQPPERRDIWGDRKDCGACFRHCLRHNKWPEDKCPRAN